MSRFQKWEYAHLEYKDTDHFDEDERAKFNLGRQGDETIINESGLYSLVLGYSNPRDALSKHVDAEDKGVANCDTLG